MQKWDYCMVVWANKNLITYLSDGNTLSLADNNGYPTIAEMLNRMARAGWELDSRDGRELFIFKRPYEQP